jgi:acetyltransferase-like isoleucine patch superfamily enzyme
MQAEVHDNVHLGEGCLLHPPLVLGFPPRGRRPGELELVIGAGAVLRPFTTIYAGTRIGDRFQCGQGASIREDNVFGDDCSVGTNAVIEHGNRIGNRTRIHSGCFLELVTLGDDVFVAPNVTFTDDPHPACPRYADCKRGAVVEDRVKIGAGAVILPGVRLGKNCLVGAGAVVTRDVEPGAVVAGVPARGVGSIDALTCDPGFFERPYVWETPEPGSPR